MLPGFQLDPYVVLGIAPGASAREVRDAFLAKSKKHHPDRGGDEWAFRIVVKAYELLGGGAAEPATGPARANPGASEQIRPGVRDRLGDPSRLVAVELVRVRPEVGDMLDLVGADRHEPEQALGGSLHLTWPDPAEAVALAADPARAAATHQILVRVFDALRAQTPVVSARSETDDATGRIDCWLNYPSGSHAWRAFKVLHAALKARGLGVRQWTRDRIVPRSA
jgi:hypothetical protein